MKLSIEPTNNVDLSSMTKAELLEFANANGIEGVDSSMLKADIYNTILNNLQLKGGLFNAILNL